MGISLQYGMKCDVRVGKPCVRAFALCTHSDAGHSKQANSLVGTEPSEGCTEAAEPEGSTPLVHEPVTGHDPEPLSYAAACMSWCTGRRADSAAKQNANADCRHA
jgi:hypothetical protein